MSTTTFDRPSDSSYSLKEIPSFAVAATKVSGILILAGTLQMIASDDSASRTLSNRTFVAHEIQRTSNSVSTNRIDRSTTSYSPDTGYSYPSIKMVWDGSTQKLEVINSNQIQVENPASESASGKEEEVMSDQYIIEKKIAVTYKIAISFFSILTVIAFLSWIGIGFLPSPIDKTVLLASLAGLLGFIVDNWKREKINGIS